VGGGPFDLTAKVAVVTGGNSGIEKAMAEGLAAAGASVSICGRSKERNQQTVASIREKGGLASCRQVDVTDESSVVEAMAGVAEE
jgi:NAD(P)-dependent dehydrogenase (short-subunit alcohol dehydrogenase family)